MKKLSDFQGEEAIDLWADIFEDIGAIVSDQEIAKYAKGNKIVLANKIIKLHKKEICSILLKIDDTPINGLNLISRTVKLLNEIGADPDLRDFFVLQGQNEIGESSGSAMENIEEDEQ